MTIAPTIRSARSMLAAILLALPLAAAMGTGASRAEEPVTVFTDDAAARRPDGPAVQLLQAAREKGSIWVIAGLRTTMRMEHTLSPLQVQQQRQALRGLQNAVASRVLGSAPGDRAERLDFIPYMALRVTPAQLERLLADPRVVSIEKDASFQSELRESIPIIHADDVFAAGFDGTGQVVAIIDSGVALDHAMLDGKIASEACYSTNLVDDDISSLCFNSGGTRVTASTEPGSAINCPVAIDGCGHGTHVASIAAGHLPILDGVARGARIIAIKVASKQGDDFMVIRVKDVVRGLQRVHELRDQFKIAAVNMSFGLPGGVQSENCDLKYPSLTTALANLRAAGIAPIKSSGNNSSGNGVTIPGCISTVIAVGNSDDTDVAHKTSNHSPMVKLFAPGTGIKAAVPGDKFKSMSGTSMAAPHVTGAFAVLKDAKPTATADDILAALACSGKIVDTKRDAGGNPVELDPPRPRIDLLGAFNRLRRPSNNIREWDFSSQDQAKDWTPLRGTWAVQGGSYRPATLLPGRTASSVANCNSNHLVIARMKRVDPGTDPFQAWNSGIIVRANINHTAETISGYWFAFNRLKNPETELIGNAVVWRVDNWNLETGDTTFASQKCDVRVPVNAGQFNTIRVMSTGLSHEFSLNGTPVCTINELAYSTGAVVVSASSPNPATGHTLQVDSVSIRSFDAAPDGVAQAAPVMDPAALRPRAILAGVTPNYVRLKR